VTSAALAVRRLSKSYAGRPALDAVDLTVLPGEVRGLLGPNGAGKSTLLRAALGLLTPDAGEVRLLGRAPGQGLADVGAALEAPRWWAPLSGPATLGQLAALDEPVSTARVPAVLDAVGLDGVRGRVGGWSVGQRQRLGLAAALLRAPRLLLLDEPTSGLDPAGRRQVHALLRDLADDGVAVLLSSHDLAEVDGACDAVTVLRAGCVVADGPLAALRAAAPSPCHLLTTTDDVRARALAGDHLEHGYDEHGLLVRASVTEVDALVIALGCAGIAVRSRALERPALDELYVTLTTGPPQLRPALLPAASADREPQTPTVAPAYAGRRPVRSSGTVCRLELVRLAGSLRARAALAGCLAGPLIFSLVLSAQDALPVDTVYGRELHASGFATPLVVLGFAGTWVLPLLVGLVAGDLFSGEDAAGTWPLLLTRSRSRGELVAGKVLAALTASALLLVALALSALVAGALGTGTQPLVSLSGTLVGPWRATVLVLAAYAATLAPVLAFAGIAVVLSVLGRRSWVGVVGPVGLGLALVLLSLAGGAAPLRPLLPTVPFEAWHGLFEDPTSTTAVWDGVLTSAGWLAVTVGVAAVVLRRREVR